MNIKCKQCKQNMGIIGNKTVFCKKCRNLLTESLFTDKDEISKIVADQMNGSYEKISVDIEIETDKYNKIVDIHYPNLEFFLGKILK